MQICWAMQNTVLNRSPFRELTKQGTFRELAKQGTKGSACITECMWPYTLCVERCLTIFINGQEFVNIYDSMTYVDSMTL